MKYPVITRLQGGLGNQLYQYAIGRAVAAKLQRPLLLDKRTIEPEAPQRHYDLGVFNIEERFVAGHLAWATRWVGSARLGATFQRIWPRAANYHYLRDAQQGFDASVFDKHKGPIVLMGYWQSYRYFEVIKAQLQEELSFTSPLDSVNRDLIDELRGRQSVAVHVRRGDYVSNASFNQSLGTCDASYYLRASEYLREQHPDVSFYVFTDDPEWARKELNLAAPFRVIDHNLGNADFEDMRLMSNCQHLIIANSSFSWWSAWLANRPGKIVTAPSTWFVDDAVPYDDRVPLDWVRL